MVDAKTYAAMRKSKAKVLSAVAVVRSHTAWGFFTVPVSKRAAPRWIFIDSASGEVVTALDRVAQLLRSHLARPEHADLDRHAIEVMERLLDQMQGRAAELLPKRKQRALEQMRAVLENYAAQVKSGSDGERASLIHDLAALACAEARVDLDELVEAWLAAIRPRWREALKNPGRGRKRGRLRRLSGLTPALTQDPISDEELRRVLARARSAPPLAERIVAAIVGVPSVGTPE